MRQDTTTWTVQHGVKMGHYHRDKFGNCQDAAGVFIRNSPSPMQPPDLRDKFGEWVGGFIADGCGEGQHSEVGANQAARMAIRQMHHLMMQGYPPATIPDLLFSDILRYINGNVTDNCLNTYDYGERAELIADYWLFTALGVIMSGDQGVIFHAGDGVYSIDDDMTVLDQNNAPTYPGYACIQDPARFGVAEQFIPKRFTTVTFNPNEIDRVMIASDGFTNHTDAMLRDPELPDSLHGQQWGRKGKIGLKLWMNTRSNKGYFNDDCAIITVERKPPDA